VDFDSGSAAIMVGWARDDQFWRQGSVEGKTKRDAMMTRLIRSSCDTACIVSGR
jgi:hypothetical protein